MRYPSVNNEKLVASYEINLGEYEGQSHGDERSPPEHERKGWLYGANEID
jgi:hypothetical protein